MKIEFAVSAAESGRKTGDILRGRGFSRRLVTKLKRTPLGITKNGCLCRTIDAAEEGDIIGLFCEDEKHLDPSSSLSAPVVYENEGVVIFDKPGDMAVHPSIKHQGDTLGNLFAARYPSLTFRPINRLDLGTSGLCAVAKNPYYASALQKNLGKVYYAAVTGICKPSGIIDLPIARAEESIIKREVNADGRPAVTQYRRIFCDGRYSLVKIILKTGRTHQIRVHFSHIGNPLVGDGLYGKVSPLISRHALHCGVMTFADPLSGEEIRCISPLPQEMKNLFAALPDEVLSELG